MKHETVFQQTQAINDGGGEARFRDPNGGIRRRGRLMLALRRAGGRRDVLLLMVHTRLR